MGDVGGDRIEGKYGDGSKQSATGKDIQQISIYSDTITWRELIKDDLRELHEEIDDLRGWCRGLLIAICILFLLGFVASALALRQFDQMQAQIQLNDRRIDDIEQRQDRLLPIP